MVSMKYQKKQQTIVGIDYSLNSPAICIAGDDFDFDKCSFHFLTSKKKHIGKFGKNNIDTSKEVGIKLAKKATKKGISQVLFDRGGYLYHGKIKSFADGAREGGLIF